LPVNGIHSSEPGRGLWLQKRRQLFISVHNETLSVVTMRVNNPDCSPFGIDG
jgi:hypothetical protein